jgi:hypothetical protein
MHNPFAQHAVPKGPHDPFVQFRRLLLGTMIEVLRDSSLDLDLSGLEVGFDPESGFRFLWVDNWLRFKGFVRVPLRKPATDEAIALVTQRVQGIWPEVLGTIGTLPLADRLESTRHDVVVTAGEALEIRFDLEAD